EVTGTQGSYANFETLGVGANSPVVTAVQGSASSAALSIAAGTTLVLANDLTVSVLPGLASSAPGVTLGGAGSLALQAPFASAAGPRAFTLADGPAANDLSIGASIIDGSVAIETQTITIAGTPTTGSFQLTGGPLTGTTAAIPLNALATQVWAAIFPLLPAGVQATVTQAGTAPNLTYTITFFNLAANPATLTVTNNTMTPGTVTPATTVDLSAPAPTDAITKTNAAGATASRMVLSGSNTYSGVVTVNGGFLQAAGNAALGAANAGEGLGTVINQGGVLELSAVSVSGEHMQLVTNNFQPGLYDTPGLFTVAQSSGVNNMFGTGELRVVGNAASTWAGNVDLRSADTTARFISIGVDSGSSLAIDGVIYGA